jgi:hypothetical protein
LAPTQKTCSTKWQSAKPDATWRWSSGSARAMRSGKYFQGLKIDILENIQSEEKGIF